MTGGSEGFFWVWDFGQKGFFWVYERCRDFFGVAKTTQGFFWVLYFSSAQINNNISAIYSFVFDQNQSWSWHVLAFQKIKIKFADAKTLRDFFGYAKKSTDFFGQTNSEVGIFWGIKYEPLSDPPSLKYVSGAPGENDPLALKRSENGYGFQRLGVNGVWRFWWDSGQGLETGQHTPPPRIPWTNLSGVSRYSKWSTTASKLSNGELSRSITV